ncbi:hypothetical protein AMIS_20970 [Actinoplanes missouriensis 431]|uniref:Uncharacterized protein n=2 Tax=Actinoplanes missouriensis TaxID=1866 RepID=I0H2T0_ACTM4|nr:hypothetical protein AMIS_20970 [Actinoplanes missouriensis 431]
MPFSLDWLADAYLLRGADVCDRGHLVINGNSHWAPLSLSRDLRALICRLVTDHTGPA